MTLENGGYQVFIDPRKPVILEIRDRESGMRLGGDPLAADPVFLLLDRGAGKPVRTDGEGWNVGFELIESGGTRAVYRASVTSGGSPACAVDLFIELSGDAVSVGFRNVQETDEFRFLTVEFPRVATVDTRSPNARMVLTTHGGRLVDPAVCADGSMVHIYNWVRDSFAGRHLLYSGPLTGIVGIDSLDDTLTSSVFEAGGVRYAGIGAVLRHRYSRSDPSYRSISLRRRDEGPPTTEGLARSTDDFIVNGSSSVTIRLIRGPALAPERGWITGARAVREELGVKPSDYYRGRFINKIFIGDPERPARIPFDDAARLIERIRNRTGGTKQVCYIVGWQHRGHDTGYPDVFTVNAAAGGMERLLALIENGKRIGATVSFHDNFDDAYADSPAWDPEDIAIDNRGELLKGGVWGGGQAFWNSMPVYARTKTADRIEKTARLYPIEETYHLDVLTASVFRLDFRKDAPCDKDDDLDGRLRIVDEFRKRGFDLTSEACGLPFIGGISYFWHMMRVPRSIYEGDRRIPLTAFIAHGRADYGGSHLDGNGVPEGLLYGGTVSDDIREDTPFENILDAYFLLHVPLDMLRDLEMSDYQEEGTKKRIVYGPDTFIQVDFESGEHTVVVGGRTVVRNGVVFQPEPAGGGYIAYVSRLCGFFDEKWPLPAEWPERGTVKAVPLLDGGEGEPVELEVEGGYIRLALPHGVAHRIRAV